MTIDSGISTVNFKRLVQLYCRKRRFSSSEGMLAYEAEAEPATPLQLKGSRMTICPQISASRGVCIEES